MILEKTLKYIVIAGLFSLLFVPFIVSNNLMYPYITGKAYFFRVVIEIIFLLWLSLAILNKEYRPKKSLILYSLVAFMISIFISNYFGANWTASFWSNYERMEGYITLLHLFALFLIAGSVFNSEKYWMWFFNLSVLVSLFMVVDAVSQVLERGFNFRVDTTLGNSTYVGVYMLMNAFLSLFLLFKKKISPKSFLTWYYSIAFILQTIVLFQTGTRGSMLGLLGGLIFASLLIIFLNKENKNLKLISISIIGIVIIFTASIFIFKNSSFIQNNSALHRIVSININEGTAQARLLNWQIAWQGVKERPIFGWGQNNYNLVFDKYYLSAMHGNEAWFDRTHNIIFDWLIAGGLFGLLLYLAILGSLVYMIWQQAPNLNAADKSILTGLLLAYSFHNIFVFDHLMSYVIFVFLLSYIHSLSDSKIESLQKSFSPSINYSIVTILVIIAPFLAYSVNANSYMASRESVQASQIIRTIPNSNNISYYYKEGLSKNLELFKKALSRNTFGNSEISQRMISIADKVFDIQDASAESVKEEFIQTAIVEMQKQQDKFPSDARFPYLLGSYLTRFGDLKNAEINLKRAIELSPNKQTLRIPLIFVYIRSDQPDKALSLAEETYNLDQSKDDIWFEYVKILYTANPELYKKMIDEAVAENDTDKVIKFLEYAIKKQPDNVQAVISLAAFYHRIGNDDLSMTILDAAIMKFPAYKYQLDKIKNDLTVGKI